MIDLKTAQLHTTVQLLDMSTTMAAKELNRFIEAGGVG